MQDQTTSAIEMRRSGGRIVGFGIAAIVLILALAAAMLFWALPDANAFNAKVERLFIENDLTTQAEVKLLEIHAQSGTAFSDTLASYRLVIFVLLVFATAMLVAALVFLVLLVSYNRRLAQIERAGIQVNSLLISREENTVYLNNLGFKLTDAAMETMRSFHLKPSAGKNTFFPALPSFYQPRNRPIQCPRWPITSLIDTSF